MAPASATATPSAGSTSRIARIRARLRTMAPWGGMEPPASPVEVPRATTGIASSPARRRIAETCSVARTMATAMGMACWKVPS